MEKIHLYNIEKENNNDINIESEKSNNSLNVVDSTSEVKLSEEPFIFQKEKYLFDKEKNEIISLYSTFKYLKSKYNIKNIRKNKLDCIVKKIKTKYLNAIHEAIKFCIKIKMQKLPQHFISNIKIEFNKMYLNKTVEQIYTEFKIIPSLNEIIDKNLIRIGKKELFIKLMNSSLKDIYQYYLKSDLYKYHRMCVIKKEGENSGKIYDYVARNICKYFMYNKGNKSNYKNNNLNVIDNNNLYETKLTNEININNNFNSIYNIKNNCNVSLYYNKLKFVVTKNN